MEYLRYFRHRCWNDLKLCRQLLLSEVPYNFIAVFKSPKNQLFGGVSLSRVGKTVTVVKCIQVLGTKFGSLGQQTNVLDSCGFY